jgi:uncharacterized protein YprB with RNaseH-like and TPR domain
MRIENSFIPVSGVGEKTERRLWQNGVTHWDDFTADALGGTTGQNVAEFIDEARQYLDAGDSRFFDGRFPSGERWRLYENFRDSACFFDIETTGLKPEYNDVTTVSFHRDGDTTTLVQGDDLTRENVQAEFDAADLLVSFNGIRFDVPFLETALDMDVQVPHLDLMYTCKKLGLSGGLKPIEKEIGIERDRPDITGRDAVRLWREHESGKDGSLETLVSYNREDTVNLQTLADEATGRLHREAFADCDADPA